MTTAYFQQYFSEPLVDLSCEAPRYASVYSPKPEVGLPRFGVSAEFLEKSESYFEKFQQYDYIFGLIERELKAFGITPEGTAIDFGCGFGNTVIPILEHFPSLKMICVDISPDLLVILNREAEKRRMKERCLAVAMDAQRDYFGESFADIVFGGAVLHHMVKPEKVVETTLKVLKPGGHAIFLEPFENGHAVLRLAYEEILEKARLQKEAGPAFEFLRGLALDIAVRTKRAEYPGFENKWESLDDKWMFTKTYFEKIARDAGAKGVQFRPLHEIGNCFTKQTTMALSQYGGFKCPDALPGWAWKIIERYDDFFSEDMKQDLLIEGSIVFTK